ncbi:MAG: HDOD domain-containing protein [Phycisphaeraceae bacterium]|nr:MAG: HDOD domain-containing protein [Phycisphaeraceae bacterium]
MNTELLEEVLDCPNLPSLPAIAVRVIEMTSDQNVSLDELAKLIQTDQAMSARILRTVNSSFYGLRERCTTIRKALVMLGLSPVKSLVLGFSLVSSIELDKDPRFDYVAYWRRGLFTAAAAKAVADAAKLHEADECFLSGLLQDIGMIALLRTLGDDYIEIIEAADNDHRKLVRQELVVLEAQHPDIGALLAQRWRLPDQLTVPIKYHERPTAAPNEHHHIVRAVAIGNYAHDVLTDDEPAQALKRYYDRCEQWFGLKQSQADEAFKRFAHNTEELSELFSLDTGDAKDPAELLEIADSHLIKLAEEEPRRSPAADQLAHMLVGEESNDPLTGLLNARGFESALTGTFSALREGQEPVSLAQVVIDGLKIVQERAGVLASDAVLIRAIAFLQKHFEPIGGIVCRVGSSILSIILPRVSSNQVITTVEQFQVQFNASLGELLNQIEVEAGTIKLSVGVATAIPGSAGEVSTDERLVAAATRAVQSARTAGGNCVKTHNMAA